MIKRRGDYRPSVKTLDDERKVVFVAKRKRYCPQCLQEVAITDLLWHLDGGRVGTESIDQADGCIYCDGEEWQRRSFASIRALQY